jgi:hypothetical protein
MNVLVVAKRTHVDPPPPSPPHTCTHTEGARRLTRAECARKHTLTLTYERHELRVSCDSNDDVERWTTEIAAAVTRAKAWEVTTDK